MKCCGFVKIEKRSADICRDVQKIARERKTVGK